MLTTPHPENLIIGRRYRFALDYDGRPDFEEGELIAISYGHPLLVKVQIAEGIESEFFWDKVLGVEGIK